MEIANAIANEVSRCQLLNLAEVVGRKEGRGPYILLQEGCDPLDPRMRMCAFVLTRRGTWLHFYLYLSLPRSVRARWLEFETAAEALHAAEGLTERAVVEEAGSIQEMVREAGFEPGEHDPVGRALLESLRSRHGFAASSEAGGSGGDGASM